MVEKLNTLKMYERKLVTVQKKYQKLKMTIFLKWLTNLLIQGRLKLNAGLFKTGLFNNTSLFADGRFVFNFRIKANRPNIFLLQYVKQCPGSTFFLIPSKE